MPKKILPEEYKEYFQQNYTNYELLSDYKGDKEYIMVRCKNDGNVWYTKPNWLKQNVGCQKCYDKRRGNTTRLDTDGFIEKAKKVHGDKYDYSKVDYKTNKVKVCVICPKHGEFFIRPDKHLSGGQGCDKCADEKNGISKRLTQEQFIEKANLQHHNKYDYSKSKYLKGDENVTITCPEHGDFVQKAGMHLLGSGCQKCNESHLEREVEEFLITNNIKFESQKRFEWLGRQSLDFYLPDYNVAIECQGSQHYDKTLYNGWNIFDTSTVIERDIRKNNLCKINKVKLLYISKSFKPLELNEIYNKENTFNSMENLILAI